MADGGCCPCYATSTASQPQPPWPTMLTRSVATARDSLPRSSVPRQTPRLRLSSLLPLLMLPLLLLTAGTEAAKRDLTVSKFDNAHIPWYQSSTKPLYYEGDRFVNSLPDLLGVQQLKNWVTVFMFNRAVQRWALNCIYSYIKFGKVSSSMHAQCHAWPCMHQTGCANRRNLQVCMLVEMSGLSAHAGRWPPAFSGSCRVMASQAQGVDSVVPA
eukprot:364615-Chlamydomonas_euryale.AAC.10